MTPLRLRILTPIASFAAALAFVGCSGESTPQVPGENDPAGSNPAPLPNIVWIVSDDQSFTDFGFMGHEVVQTPRIDDLAAQSLVFRHGYNPTSLCRPGLATLITGKHQHEHGLTFNDPEPGVRRGIANQFLLRQRPAPSLLAEAGYASLQTGKFWEGSYRNGGFSEGMTVGERHGDLGLTIGREGMEPIRDFVRRRKHEPMFIWYAPFLPHLPHNAPDEYEAPFADLGLHELTLRYYASILWFDKTVGELIDLMKAEGEYEETIFIFIVDNGWVTAENEADRLVDRSDGTVRPPHWKSKQSQYDLGVRTPVLLHWPGRIAPGVSDELVSSIDLLPTSLAAAGLDIPENLPGLNLLPRALHGEPLARDAVFGSIFRHTAKDWDRPDANVLFRWIRAGDWKLILPEIENEPLELYHLAEDPLENVNLAQHPEQVERIRTLRARLDAWWTPGLEYDHEEE